LATFLQGGVGIHLGTRNAQLEPNGARAVAVQVDEDAEHLTVYISEVAFARLRADLHSNGLAAVVFGRPTDDRACQVKATFVSERPAADAERPFLIAQWNGFLDQLALIGIPAAATQGWTTWPAVAVRLRATAVFEQTPGPAAGAQLK